MVYNELGKTGMKLSNLGFGASSLGGVFHDIREAEGIQAVFTAIEKGINFIDVSPYYGHYKAETVLGKALKDIPRDKYYLSTKVGRYGKDGVNTWDYSAQRVTDSVYESMERLNIDYIDIINVHDVEFQAGLEGGLQKVVDETLPALVKLREKGVVKHVGITDLQPENLKWVIEHSEPGTVESSLLSQRRTAARLSRLLRGPWHRSNQCFAFLHGTAVAAWRPCMASGPGKLERGMSESCRLLYIKGLSHRKACYTVFYQPESTYCHHLVQFCQSQECNQECRVCECPNR